MCGGGILVKWIVIGKISWGWVWSLSRCSVHNCLHRILFQLSTLRGQLRLLELSNYFDLPFMIIHKFLYIIAKSSKATNLYLLIIMEFTNVICPSLYTHWAVCITNKLKKKCELEISFSNMRILLVICKYFLVNISPV